MKEINFVFVFTCEIKGINIANRIVTRIEYYAKIERIITLIKTNFYSESETGRTRASKTTGRIKIPEAARIYTERATASLPKFSFTTRLEDSKLSDKLAPQFEQDRQFGGLDWTVKAIDFCCSTTVCIFFNHRLQVASE